MSRSVIERLLEEAAQDLPPRGTRVAVGLSGGLDSSMAALLLREHGCEVIGVTMAIWDGSLPIPDRGRSGCFGPGEARDLQSAEQTAKRLGIDHRVIRLADEYRERILDYVRAEYRSGRTPNPCVRCNRTMKFGALLERARAEGLPFDRFATGHYARLAHDPVDGRYRLYRAADRRKDQSYFLAHLSQQQLGQLAFPLGSLHKDAVRKAARHAGFDTLADQAESQDFLEADSLDVLFAGDTPPEGDIVDERGTVLGRHRGLVYYTIGQRKGLGLGGAGEPYFVVRLDARRNRVVVGRRGDLQRQEADIGACSWIAWERPPEAPWQAELSLRLRQAPARATIRLDPERHDAVHVVFEEPQISITPGQTAVFYRDNETLGAGTIRG